jgi:hypothetical protein
MDGEFEPLRDDLLELQITLNTTANDEHVGDIERYIRTVKERVRCIYNTLPFTLIPYRLIVEMVYFSIFWLNSFPPSDGISTMLSPRALVTGQQLDFNKHCKLEFGAYVQTHEQHDNSMDSRTIGAIALRPTGNTQGGYFFMSLATGRRITRRSWTALPMPQDVIDRVNTIAQQQNVNRGLLFLDRNGLCDDDDLADDADDGADDDDDTYYPPDHTEAEPDDLYYDDTDEPDDLSFGDAPPFAGNPTGVNHNNNDNDEQNNEQNNDGNENTDDNDNNTDNENDNDNDDGNENTDDNDNNTDNENENDNEHNDGNENTDDTDNNNDDDDNNDDSDDEQKMNKLYGPRTSAYDLRPRRPRDYGHLHTTLDGIMMTQHSLKQGLKLYAMMQSKKAST